MRSLQACVGTTLLWPPLRRWRGFGVKKSKAPEGRVDTHLRQRQGCPEAVSRDASAWNVGARLLGGRRSVKLSPTPPFGFSYRLTGDRHRSSKVSAPLWPSLATFPLSFSNCQDLFLTHKGGGRRLLPTSFGHAAFLIYINIYSRGILQEEIYCSW